MSYINHSVAWDLVKKRRTHSKLKTSANESFTSQLIEKLDGLRRLLRIWLQQEKCKQIDNILIDVSWKWNQFHVGKVIKKVPDTIDDSIDNFISIDDSACERFQELIQSAASVYFWNDCTQMIKLNFYRLKNIKIFCQTSAKFCLYPLKQFKIKRRSFDECFQTNFANFFRAINQLTRPPEAKALNWSTQNNVKDWSLKNLNFQLVHFALSLIQSLYQTSYVHMCLIISRSSNLKLKVKICM